MPQIFNQALDGTNPSQTQGMTPYQLALLRAINPGPIAPPKPMFTPDQIQQRVGANNALTEAGILGGLSSDPQMANMGGAVFKQALAQRNPVVVPLRGMIDPITGEEHASPAYMQEHEEARGERALEAALRFHGSRVAAQEKSDQQAAHDQANQELRLMLAGIAAGGKADMNDLKQLLIRAQISNLNDQVTDRQNTRQFATARQQAALEHTKQTADAMNAELDKAYSMVDGTTTGLAGAAARGLTTKTGVGTKAFDLQKILDTVKANIGFDALAQMRRESPKGGALGNVAVKEIEFLQATLGNLDLRQSQGQVQAQIRKIQQHFKNISANMASDIQRIGAEASGGGAGTDIARPISPASPAPAPAPAPSAGATPPAAGAPPAPRPRRAYNPDTGEIN